MLEKALQVKTAEELMALAKAEGIELTKEEAEAYMVELSDFELDEEKLKKIAGGEFYCSSQSCPYACTLR
jgi:predicted DNA-binding protein